MKDNRLKKEIENIFDSPELLGRILGYKALNSQHGEWIKDVHFKAKKDLTLMAHRGSYKTTAITVVGIIWALLFFPDRRYLVASSTHENAKKIIAEIKNHYNTNEGLRALYAACGVSEIVDKDRWTKESFSITTKKKPTKEGNVECIGVGGVLTSRHYDYIISDDIVTIKDRYSEAERIKKKNWVKELQSIIDPGGIIAYIGTPWHEEDVYSITPEPKKWPVGKMVIKGLTESRLIEIRRMQGESFYASQYLLEHIADGDRLLDNPVFIDYRPQKLFAYLDPAFTESGDYSALTIAGNDEDGNIHVYYADLWQAQIDESYNKVENICKELDTTTIYIESNAAQRLVCVELRKRGFNVQEVNNSKNKHLRIMDGVKKNWDSITFQIGLNGDYMKQVLDYTEFSTYDDAPDSLAGIVKILVGATHSYKIGRGRRRAS